MKIAEKAWADGHRLNILETHDFNPALKTAADLRSMGAGSMGESKLAAVIPMKLWHEWAKAAGVKPNDHEAMKDVVARQLNDPDNAEFRVWGGRI